MKKIFVFLCSVMLIFTLSGVAAAAAIEDYRGRTGIYEDQSLYFHFDLIEPWDATDTNADLTELPLYADMIDVIGPYSSLFVYVELSSRDDELESSKVGLAINGSDWIIHELDNWNNTPQKIEYELTAAQVAAFTGDATVTIYCPFDGSSDTNSFYIDRVAFGSSSAAPEPATMLLLGSGLVSIVGVSRRKFKRGA